MKRNLTFFAIAALALAFCCVTAGATSYTIELTKSPDVNHPSYGTYAVEINDLTALEPWQALGWLQAGSPEGSGSWCFLQSCTIVSRFEGGPYTLTFVPHAGHVYNVTFFGYSTSESATIRVLQDGAVVRAFSHAGPTTNWGLPLYRIMGDGIDLQLELGQLTTTDEQRRVLLSNGGYTAQQQPYFSTAQVEDGKLKIRGWAKFGTPATTSVYFKLEDPPGTAPYEVGANGDNSPLPGILSTSTAQVQGDGSFETTLQVTNLNGNGTGHAASGDNYRVVASLDGKLQTDPEFVCTASDCGQTGVLTAWKRAFVEFDRMFKKGTYIKGAAPSTGLRLSVVNSSGFTKGSQIAVLHAPQHDGLDPTNDNVSWETATVKARGTGFIELYPPGVSGVYHQTRTSSEPWRADAVGLLTGTLGTETFDANVSMLPQFFDEAFVEIKILDASKNSTPYVPYEEVTYAADRAKTISDRWFETAATNNHIHLISANRESKSGEQLMGATRDSSDFTIIFESRINDMVNKQAHRTLLSGEVVTHELIHQWKANGGTTSNGDHCLDEPTYDTADGALFCIMKAGFQSSVSPYPMLPEFYDGKVMGHFKSQVGSASDSEYLRIRQHIDPSF